MVTELCPSAFSDIWRVITGVTDVPLRRSNEAARLTLPRVWWPRSLPSDWGLFYWHCYHLRDGGTDLVLLKQSLDSYYSRLGKKFWEDATPWARDNIVLGLVVLLLPPTLTFFRDRHAQILSTLILYGFALPLYFLVHLIRTPKKLDQERDAREAALRQEMSAKDETIRQQSAALEKHKYTVAEQHDYEIAKKALKTLGQRG